MSEEQLHAASYLMKEGWTLKQAAHFIGAMSGELDRELWRHLGANKPWDEEEPRRPEPMF